MKAVVSIKHIYCRCTGQLLCLLLVFFLASCGSGGADHSASDADPPAYPNVVLIISDDHGWDDYGFAGHPVIETPNIDRLASTGLTFTRGYVTAPLCRPSLASIATGLYAHQHSVVGNVPIADENGPTNASVILKFSEIDNLNDYFHQRGYLTLQTGKWWEGSWQTGRFDYGMTHGIPALGGRHGDDGLAIGRDTMGPIVRFLDDTAQADRPFFIWYAPFLPHTPHNPPEHLLNKYLLHTTSAPVARYWASVEWLDQTIGQLLAELEQRNLLRDTLIIYTSDNGWEQNPNVAERFLIRSKRSPYEKGIRTPIILNWPEKISADLNESVTVSNIDIAPTILDVLGLEKPNRLQGISLIDHAAVSARPTIFAENFDHNYSPDDILSNLNHRIAINSDWKLIVHASGEQSGQDNASVAELFHIRNDPEELIDLSFSYPDIVQELKAKIASWWLIE